MEECIVTDELLLVHTLVTVGDVKLLRLGIGFTETLVVLVAVNPFPSVAVTVYVVVDAGVAITGVPVTLDNPVGGNHE